MSMLKEFKEFAMRGNVVDLAVGIIIGGAFGTIVKSMVDDVIMPPIGMLTGGIDFSKLKLVIQEGKDGAEAKAAVMDGDTVVTPAVEAIDAVSEVAINYGSFINNVITFLIVAFAVFMLVKIMNSLQKQEEEKPAAPPEPSGEEKLLGEIRDLLAKKA